HTIRVWERRYPGFDVKRSKNGRRLYTEGDIRRLSLLKKLIDNGHKIGDLAACGIAQLEHMLALAPTGTGQAQPLHKPRVAVWGESLADTVKRDSDLPAAAEIIVNTHSIAALKSKLENDKADALILEMDTIQRKNLAFFRDIQRLAPTAHLIVVFHYAYREVLAELRRMNAQLLRAPIDSSQLLYAVAAISDTAPEAGPKPAGTALPLPGQAPPHQFDRRQLNQLAALKTAVECECPHHLVNLVVAMSAFESYSQQCEIRNDSDAALHAEVYRITAQARYMMETALQRVIEAEGISLKK
ncbi:MAG: MerR family transcriptional regulator, partial [Cytophagales bacterium]|nr:MerR family transcriptional regulator [Cytophagales bacterium]